MKKRILILIVVYFSLILVALLVSCQSQIVGDDPVEMICVYKINDTQTNGGCLPNCPPRITFELCDLKSNAFRYDLEKYEIEDCDCELN